MSRDDYAPWGAALDDEDFGCALAAAGVVAAAGTWPQREDDAANRPVYRAFEQALVGRVDEHALAWTDPRSTTEWSQVRTTEASRWAAVWRDGRPGWPLRLAVRPAADTDPAWLIPLLTSPAVGADTAFVALAPAADSPPWRFPIRFGLPDTPDGRTLHRALVASTAEGWRRDLIEPLVIGRERVTCDVLVLPGPRTIAVDALRDVRQIHAHAVLGLRPLQPWDPVLVADVRAITGAWAVGFCQIDEPVHWLGELTRELSHNAPLDYAFARTAGRWGGVLAAAPMVVDTHRVTDRAMSVAATLRRDEVASEDPTVDAAPLADELENLAATGEFLSEAGDASELARMERRAGPLIDRAAAARRLQARIEATRALGVARDRLLADAEHRIDVRIGRPDAGWLEADAAFPEDQLPPGGPHRLTVVLTEPDLLERPQVDTIELPVVGNSTVATFTLTTRPDTVAVDARVLVLAGNRVLQTARLPDAVDPAGHETAPGAEAGVAAADGDRRVDPAQPETVVAPLAGDLGERRSFDAALVVGRDTGGATGITAVADDVAGIVRLDDATVTGAVDKISRRLGEIVETPEDFASLDADGSVELLVFLANHGRLMHQVLVRDELHVAEVLASSRYLQIVSAHKDTYFPFELAYEFDAPKPDATLCPHATAALQSDDPTAGCPGEHTRETVCPLGFWGLTRVIERHTFTAAEEVTGAFMLRGHPTRDRGTVRLGSNVVATSDRVDNFAAGSIDSVVAALRATGGAHRRVAAWDEWSDAVTDERPSLLMLLPHTVFNDVTEQPGLEIGADERRWLPEIDTRFMPPEDTPAVVALLGCETARAGQLSYEQFPKILRLAGAKVIIATLTEILGRHAAPIARRFTEELHAACADGPVGVGEVFVRLRRHLVAGGMLPVLALAAFGDADWLITTEAA